MNKAIYFDMDGTIANLYGDKNWLAKLQDENETVYANANVLINMNTLAKYLNKLQKLGYTIGVVSWLAKNGTKNYNEKVAKVKKQWLKKHLKTVKFNEIKIVEYGTPKYTVVENQNGILFDDEKQNRQAWKGQAYDEKNILEILKNLVKNA